MAKIIRREWTSAGPLGKRVRHTAFGYTITVNGKRERKVSSDWTCEEDALKALSERQQQVRAGQTDRPVDVTLGQAAERYLKFKSDHGKRSLHEDVRTLTKQVLPFGAGPRFANSPRRRSPPSRSGGFSKSASVRCAMSSRVFGICSAWPVGSGAISTGCLKLNYPRLRKDGPAFSAKKKSRACSTRVLSLKTSISAPSLYWRSTRACGRVRFSVSNGNGSNSKKIWASMPRSGSTTRRTARRAGCLKQTCTRSLGERRT